MKQVVLREFGNSDVLKLEEVGVPEIEADEVLVKQIYIGVNPIDVKTRKGMGVFSKENLPASLGWDICGEVVALGNAVQNVNVGDVYFGMGGFPQPANAYAEYLKVKSEFLALKDPEVDILQIGGISVAGLTALQVIKSIPKHVHTIVVSAAGGGVGHILVQVAKIKGFKVVAVGSLSKKEFIKSLGADVVLSYDSTDYSLSSVKYDCVIDGVGPSFAVEAIAHLEDNGTYICLPSAYKTNELLKEACEKRNIEPQFVRVSPSKDELNELQGHIKNGHLSVEVMNVFSLKEVALAHDLLEKGHAQGKILMKV